MELPIQVMIILFVSILVGSSVILFSTDIINDAKKTIFKGEDNKPDQDFVIEINELTNQGLKVLMTDCFNKHSQSAMSRTPCYVVHARDQIAQFSPDVDFETDVTYSSGRNTLLIYYNPNGNKVEVQN